MSKQKKDVSPFWLENPHGIVVAMPRWRAEQILATKIGWKISEPGDSPQEKEYPIDTELTEKGMKRRGYISKVKSEEGAKVNEPIVAPEKDEVAAPDSLVVSEEKLTKSIEELRALAKEKGIDNYWVKGEAKLLKELNLK